MPYNTSYNVSTALNEFNFLSAKCHRCHDCFFSLRDYSARHPSAGDDREDPIRTAGASGRLPCEQRLVVKPNHEYFLLRKKLIYLGKFFLQARSCLCSWSIRLQTSAQVGTPTRWFCMRAHSMVSCSKVLSLYMYFGIHVNASKLLTHSTPDDVFKEILRTFTAVPWMSFSDVCFS